MISCLSRISVKNDGRMTMIASTTAYRRYATKGSALFQSGFLAINQISPSTLHRHIKSVGRSAEFELCETNHCYGTKGQPSSQTIIFLAFLRRHAELFGSSQWYPQIYIYMEYKTWQKIYKVLYISEKSPKI